jgi:hypothetical protein
MIREHIFTDRPDPDQHFRWRSREVSRIEGLSDAVFGFAVTLLVVSLEVPHTCDDLARMMAGFPAFAASFVLLVLIWHAQYRFFRRYGLEDTRTLVLNIVLLFVVLCYIYPLKFLVSALGWIVMRFMSGERPGGVESPITDAQWPLLMIMYGVGYIAIYAVFALLYRHAHAQRAALALDPVETLFTRFSLYEYSAMIAVAVLSVLLTLAFAYGTALPGWFASAIGGWTYFLIWPVQVMVGRRLDGQRRALTAPQITQMSPAPSAAPSGQP